MTIEEAIKEIRKEMGLSQEDLARALNISYTTINRWENKKAKPSRLAIIQLKEYCADKNLSDEITAVLKNTKY